MSDSVTKWHEMQEEKIDECCGTDCGCHQDNMNAARVSQQLEYQLKQKAYTLLCEYDAAVIRVANKILDAGE